MTLSRRLIGSAIGIGVAGFLVIGLAAPFLSADRFRSRIQRALESAIGRKVEIGKVRLDLFQGPGFSLEKVVIYDDPAFGIEPFAWVETLEARPRWLSLWKRKLEFASLRLGDPSVNLVKTTHWNFERYLDPRLIAALPKIAVRGGRINFKFGDTRSVYYVTNADLDIEAPAGLGADWRFEFTGEPARTDQPARGLGYFSGKGRWHGDAVRLDLELERSALGELTTLVSGRDLGVHGMVSARAIIAGPLSALKVNGRLQIEEPHRWDQTPASGERWPMNFSGTLDLPGQRFSVDSAVTGGAVRPLAVRYRVNSYLTEPRWSVAVTWNRFPAEPVLPILARLGVRLPEGVKLNGAIDGAVGYSSHGSLQGSVALREGKLIFSGAPELKLAEASATLDGDRLHVNPLELDSGGSRVTAEADYWWSKGSLALNLTADNAAVRALPLQAAGLRANFLEPLRTGRWSGRLSHINGEWSGQAQLRDASVDVPGIAQPVALSSLRLRIQGDRLAAEAIQGSAGQVPFSGDYRYEPGAARPHRFRFAVEQADAAQLERLFQPALRPRQGFLQRTLGIGRQSLPEWLAALRADGRIAISTLRFGVLALQNVEARVQWDAAQVRFTELRAKLESGAVSGDLALSLRAAGPLYRANLKASGLEFRHGSLDGDATLETSGAGAELLARLRAEGSFSGQGWDLGSLRDVNSVAGAYRFEKGRLDLRDIEVTAGGDLYLGSGASQSDGRLELSLAAGPKQMKVSGTLAQWRVE